MCTVHGKHVHMDVRKVHVMVWCFVAWHQPFVYLHRILLQIWYRCVVDIFTLLQCTCSYADEEEVEEGDEVEEGEDDEGDEEPDFDDYVSFF
jgi:hypothetical protein